METIMVSIGMWWILLVGCQKSNQIKSLLLSHHHSTSALGEWNSYERAPDSAEKTTDNLHMGQTVQKKQQQTIYIWTTVQKNNKQFTYGTDIAKKKTAI